MITFLRVNAMIYILNLAAFLKSKYRQVNALIKSYMAVNIFGNIYYIVSQKCITIHLFTAKLFTFLCLIQ